MSIDVYKASIHMHIILKAWLPWGSWSRCSLTCDVGEERRVRTCNNGEVKRVFVVVWEIRIA